MIHSFKRYIPSSLVFISILIFHWQVVQVVAWAWMLASYSLVHGPLKGFEMTFSGNFPCPLCQLVNSGQAWESGFWSEIIAHPMWLALPIAVVLAALSTVIVSRRLAYSRISL